MTKHYKLYSIKEYTRLIEYYVINFKFLFYYIKMQRIFVPSQREEFIRV